MAAPLEGIKVLDLSRLAPGPYCTMILGDLGADVLKIEEVGLSGRRAAVQGAKEMAFWLTRTEMETAYNTVERNKRSIALNLKADEGKQIFYKLAETADVLVEEFRPGVMKRLGADYETVKELNPHLVYCSITGYGQDGPYQNLVGHDLNYISIAGAQGVIGVADGKHAIPLNLLADYAGGGLNAAVAILAALLARGKTGQGQYIDIAMADGVIYLMAHIFAEYLYTARTGKSLFGSPTNLEPKPGQWHLSGGLPEYNIYQTKDGKYISIASQEPWFYQNLFRLIGREDLIPLRTDPKRQPELFAALREAFLTKTRDEWFDLMTQTDICVGKVYSLEEVLTDPQVQHRNMIVEIEHPTLGKIPQVGISLKLSDTPGEIRSLGSLHGQNTREVLQELGYSQEEINSLKEKGVIK